MANAIIRRRIRKILAAEELKKASEPVVETAVATEVVSEPVVVTEEVPKTTTKKKKTGLTE